MTYIARAVFVIFGIILLNVGPVSSAAATAWPSKPSAGRRAMAIKRMPSPPSQCVKQRQKSMPFGRISMLECTDDPVVERPEADSKKASIKFGIVPDITYGSDDIAEAAIQQNETIRKPSLILNGTGEG